MDGFEYEFVDGVGFMITWPWNEAHGLSLWF